MDPRRDFVGKTVVIVEAAWHLQQSFMPDSPRNIHAGAAAARLFAARGAEVIIIDPDSAALKALGDEIVALGGHAQRVEMSCTDATELTNYVSQLNQTVDVLVNCHSRPEVHRLAEASYAALEQAVRDDLLGPLFATKAFLPLLKRAEGASVIHVGSIDGIHGNPQIPSYSMAKGGLIPLTHVMADEFAEYGIRVNCVARGMTADPDEPDWPAYAPLVAQTPIARPAYPEEVAEAICFLASDAASYINGVVLPVDGGRTAITPGTRRQG